MSAPAVKPPEAVEAPRWGVPDSPVWHHETCTYLALSGLAQMLTSSDGRRPCRRCGP